MALLEEEKAEVEERPKTPTKEVEKGSEKLAAPSPIPPQAQAPDVAGASSVKTPVIHFFYTY